MERRTDPQPKQNTVVVRQEFLPSAQMTAVARSFLTEDAHYIPIQYVSDRAARLTPIEYTTHAHTGELSRVQQMARNTEQTLYPSGAVTVELGSSAVRLLIELQPFGAKQLQLMGDRLERLQGARPITPAEDVIVAEMPISYAADFEQVEQASESFHKKIDDEFVFRHFRFKPTRLDVDHPFRKRRKGA